MAAVDIVAASPVTRTVRFRPGASESSEETISAVVVVVAACASVIAIFLITVTVATAVAATIEIAESRGAAAEDAIKS